MPNGPLRIWDATCSSCRVLSQLTPARSERGLERERIQLFTQAAVPALPRLEPSDPTESRQLWLCCSKEVVGGGPDVAKDRISNSTPGFSFYLEGEVVRDMGQHGLVGGAYWIVRDSEGTRLVTEGLGKRPGEEALPVGTEWGDRYLRPT